MWPDCVVVATPFFDDDPDHGRYHEGPRKRHAGRRLLRAGQSHPKRKEENQGKDHETEPLDQPEAHGVNYNPMSQTLQMAITSDSPIYLTTDTIHFDT